MSKVEKYIGSDPNIMLGKPTIKGTRVTVETILQKMADGFTPDEIVQMYPHLEIEHIGAAISYAALLVANEEVIRAA